MSPKRRFPIAEVLWEDDFIDDKDLVEKDLSSLCPVVRSTAGYFISSNDDCLVLSTDLYQEDRGKEDPMIIPWRSILAVWEFEVH
jgi:hypothetical protein|tara:strand:- start:154 stop:408 length:255 start_codon:yes stop_codon:yes gene_type:complete